MQLEIFIIDAFTSKQFKGNSAAVVPLKEWIEIDLMQKIAFENNLSETAFIKEIQKNSYEIRWFSPLSEVDFCGHATLASSFVLFNYFDCKEEIIFLTQKVGSISVIQLDNKKIQMSFPNQAPKPVDEIPKALIKGLSIKPEKVLINRQAYVIILNSEDEVKSISYNTQELKKLAPYDVVVSAKGKEYDFVSRYFWPSNGGIEDPVTGSIHSCLAPYWADKLSKQNLIAYQASTRGGILECSIKEDKVLVSGDAVLYLKGKIFI